jgi:hypothetical protein
MDGFGGKSIVYNVKRKHKNVLNKPIQSTLWKKVQHSSELG